jgi:hypothetical protein
MPSHRRPVAAKTIRVVSDLCGRQAPHFPTSWAGSLSTAYTQRRLQSCIGSPSFCGSSSATCARGSHKIPLYGLPTKLLMQPMVHAYAVAFNAKVTMTDMRPQSSRVLVHREHQTPLLRSVVHSVRQLRPSSSVAAPILTPVRGSGLGRPDLRKQKAERPLSKFLKILHQWNT